MNKKMTAEKLEDLNANPQNATIVDICEIATELIEAREDLISIRKTMEAISCILILEEMRNQFKPEK